MSQRLIVRPLAEDDLAAAREWYEEQTPGLGAELIASVDDMLTRIVERPRMYPIIYRTVRRAVLRRFPYLLYFVQQKNSVILLGCLHSKRNPKLIRSRFP